MKNKIADFFKSKQFKKLTLILGAIFFILTFFISFNPKPFLQFGYLGVFFFNLFGPGTILFPSLLKHMNLTGLALATTAGMALNDSVSWLIGKSGDVIVKRSKKIERIEKSIEKYGAYALFFWSLIPFPYDLVGLAAGYLEFPYRKFLFATFLGRFIRFILLGMGIVKFFS